MRFKGTLVEWKDDRGFGFIDSRIILIDGTRLATLMVDHNVGVTTVGTYEVKKIDADYFKGE